MRVLLAPLLALGLAGCVAQASQQTQDPELWGRVDCQRGAGNPVLEQEFEQAKAICGGRAQAAGISASASMPAYGRGIGGAIADGIAQGITSAQVSNATAMSCMAELGYIKRPQSAHVAACTAIQEQQRQVAEAEAAKSKHAKR